MKIVVPAKHRDYVRSFCRHLVSGSQPVYVSHQPLADKPLKECFSIVPEHIAAHGGKQKFGWAILELKRVWLEAEFHTVWQRKDGTLIDLTPRQITPNKILFLPDPKRQYQGIPIQSVIRPISRLPAIDTFIRLAGEHYRTLYKRELSQTQRGDIDTTRLLKIEDEMRQVMRIIQRKHFS